MSRVSPRLPLLRKRERVMGEFKPAEFAYMVPVMDGKVPEGDPAQPTLVSIYKVKVSDVASFKKRHDIAGGVWVPIYDLQDATDYISLKSDTEDD